MILAGVLALAPAAAGRPAAEQPAEARYEFRVERGQLRMRDGTAVALTYYLPEGAAGERFPVLFEMHPYRKDDLFARRDYSLYSYFARRGFALAKADVRGTGSSAGAVPDREYSREELDDAVEIIGRLSRMSWSNGRVGMWGISWSGINAIQTAMRRPPALKAILAACASDDLFHDDVHYIDGAFHVDEYELSVENDLSLPRWPDYRLDEEYFRDRFEREPWFLTFKKRQRDGPFWRGESLRWGYDRLQVPAFLIGGLLDGYRDSVPRMLENLRGPVQAIIGPGNHAWPDDGVPGPVREWRDEAVRWWDRWLRAPEGDAGAPDGPRLAVFVREGDAPDAGLKTASGGWRLTGWPVAAERRRWYLNGDHGLGLAPQPPLAHRLAYRPGAGTAAGFWWGEATGDMSEDDAASLVYDSPVLEEAVTVIGMPRARLRAAADVELAHWTVRLEDVWPDGRVALVTGGLLNGSQRDSRLEPAALEPGRFFDLALDLHWTTWVFQPGHRIRLAVSNAQFPMMWPTPRPTTSRLQTGTEASSLELPVAPARAAAEGGARPAHFAEPAPREESPHGRTIATAWPKRYEVIRDTAAATTAVEWEGEDSFVFEGRGHRFFERTRHEVSEADPADAGFHGEAGHDVELEGRAVSVRTVIDVRSDAANFHVTFTRAVSENGRLVREKRWRESIPRAFQ